jgi:hypothetical protein
METNWIAQQIKQDADRKRKADLEGIAIIASGVIVTAILFFAQVYGANCSRGHCGVF